VGDVAQWFLGPFYPREAMRFLLTGVRLAAGANFCIPEIPTLKGIERNTEEDSPNIEIRNPKQIQMIKKLQCSKWGGSNLGVWKFSDFGFIWLLVCFGFRYSDFGFCFSDVLA
jgi:hypothetical protein